MTNPKKLIEVAMPIKEISDESVRDKSIRHGHISTLHLWWARRPLPVCRAVVFASLVPDPLDPNCPQAFKDAIELVLGKKNNPGDPYATYSDIPWTSVFDPMEDNLRNRLQMFIGKFTNDMQNHLLGKAKKTEAKKMLSDASLINNFFLFFRQQSDFSCIISPESNLKNLTHLLNRKYVFIYQNESIDQ